MSVSWHLILGFSGLLGMRFSSIFLTLIYTSLIIREHSEINGRSREIKKWPIPVPNRLDSRTRRRDPRRHPPCVRKMQRGWRCRCTRSVIDNAAPCASRRALHARQPFRSALFLSLTVCLRRDETRAINNCGIADENNYPALRSADAFRLSSAGRR